MDREKGEKKPRSRALGPEDMSQEPIDLPEGLDEEGTVDLVRRAQEGDAEALNDLFARYHNVMLEVARRRLGPRLRLKEDPDDLAQTTFREATRDFASYQYRGTGSLLRWLIQILHNKIRDKAEFYSAGKRNTALETNLDAGSPDDSMPRIEPASPDLSVTGQVNRNENFELLRQALQDLTPEYRTAITLVFFEGLTLREAGERMDGRSEDAVRMMLRRAEGKLREALRHQTGEAGPPPAP